MKYIAYLTATVGLLTLLASQFAAAQDKVPQSLDYQAVARDMNGYPIANKEVVVEVTIRSEWEEGEIMWQEIHKVVTNEFGRFSLEIGKGKSTLVGTAESFDEITWSKSDFFIQTRVDFGGQRFGDGMVNMGISKLQSVPYAFVADSAMKAPPAKMNMNDIQDVNTSGVTEKQALVWSGTTWQPGDVEGDYVRLDGTTDLTGDWTIDGNSITINNGSLTTGGLVSNTLSVGGSDLIEGFSRDTMMGGVTSDHKVVPTQLAVKTFVENSLTGGAWTLDGTYVYNLDQKVGIGTSTPQDKFQADIGKNGFLVTGSFDEVGSTPISHSGAGTLMGFFAGKAAFRAGRLKDDINAWNNDFIGNYSVAMGLDVRAEGDFSASFGYKNNSSGARSFSSGQDNLASGLSSIAMGISNNAEGPYSIAMGQKNSALVQASAAIGYNNEPDGKYSLALGDGNSTSNKGIAALAAGKENSANGNYSIALGYGTRSNTLAEISVGRYNYTEKSSLDAHQSWYSTDQLFAVGNGELTNRSNAFVVMKDAKVGIGLGQDAPSSLLQVGKSGDGTQAIANTWSTFSDRRLKTDLRRIDKPLKRLNSIKGYYYHWKNKADTSLQVGVIAQEVERFFPEIVQENKEGIKTVDYSKLTPLLIEALKEQQKIIEKLKNENEAYESDLESMKTKYKAIDNRLEKLEEMLKYTQH